MFTGTISGFQTKISYHENEKNDYWTRPQFISAGTFIFVRNRP